MLVSEKEHVGQRRVDQLGVVASQQNKVQSFLPFFENKRLPTGLARLVTMETLAWSLFLSKKLWLSSRSIWDQNSPPQFVDRGLALKKFD